MKKNRSYNEILLTKMIRHALYKGWHKPYIDSKSPLLDQDTAYTIPIENDRSRKKFLCVDCTGIFRDKEIKRDHIEPIISIYEAENGYEDIMERAFCPISGLQLLCISCHNIKTYLENELRRR